MDGSSNEDAACFETYFRDDGVEFVDDVVDALPGFGEDVAALVGADERGTPRSSESDESEEMTLAIRAHPMYSRLVEAYYECRKIGADGGRARAREECDVVLDAGDERRLDERVVDVWIYRRARFGRLHARVHARVGVIRQGITHGVRERQGVLRTL